eukprot:1559593-Amphidinium_carterae.1
MKPQFAAIEDEVPEEENEDDPTAPKKGGPKKATPPRTFKVFEAYNSDKKCPDGENYIVKKKSYSSMKEKCLNCGGTSHLKATCNRPMAAGRNLKAEYAEE